MSITTGFPSASTRTWPHRRRQVQQPLLQLVPGVRDPRIAGGCLGEVPQRSVEDHPLAGRTARRSSSVDHGDLAVRGRPVKPHRLQELREPGHDRSGPAPVAREQLLQTLAWKVLDDRKVGRTVGAVTIDETDRRDADAEGVQPRVCGLEDIEPEAGRERVGEVVVALGGGPVVLGDVPQVGDRRRRVVHHQAVHALLTTARDPLDHLQPPSAAQRGPRRTRQLLSRH